jgi:hypothetical protein
VASTYIPNIAFDKAVSYVKDMPLHEVKVRILDQVQKMMWMASPWRWTIGDLPVTTLLANTTDYSIALPSDFLYAIDAFFTDKDDQTHPLLVEPALPADVGAPGTVSRIAITGTAGSTGTLRVAPKPGTTLPAPAPVIISLYKKTSPVLTDENVHTAGTLTLPSGSSRRVCSGRHTSGETIRAQADPLSLAAGCSTPGSLAISWRHWKK